MLSTGPKTGRPLHAAVLIGGQSRRMGRPKAMLTINGESLLRRTLRVIAPHVECLALVGTPPSELTVVVKSCSDEFRLMLLDDAPEAQGPLAGILGALRHDSSCDWIVIACDMPDFNEPALKWLVAQHGPESAVTIGVLPESHAMQPLPGIFTPPARAGLEACAAAQTWSLRTAIGCLRSHRVGIPAEHASAWRNINTPDEWDGYLQATGRVIDPLD